MDSKAQIHARTISFLEKYLESMPADIIRQDIEEIGKADFSGPSAEEYFSNFHNYYLGEEIVEGEPQPTVKTKKSRRVTLSSLS